MTGEISAAPTMIGISDARKTHRLFSIGNYPSARSIAAFELEDFHFMCRTKMISISKNFNTNIQPTPLHQCEMPLRVRTLTAVIQMMRMSKPNPIRAR